MSDRNPFDQLLAGLEPTRPPKELRARVAREAAAAFVQSAHHSEPGLWTRLWSSTSLRVAWAATVLALLVAHAGLSLQATTQRTPPTNQPAYLIAGAPDNTELAEIVSLTRLSTDHDPSFELERRPDHAS